MEALGGPLQRSRSVVWLCFEEDSYADAVRWACVLCREFALGGACGAAAAVALLGEVLPGGVGGDSAVERLLRAAEQAGAGDDAAELRGWIRFFELEVEFASWEAVYEKSVTDIQASGQDPSQGGLLDLANDTLPLLNAAVEFLKEGPCPWLVTSTTGAELGMGPLPPAGEIAIVVGPDTGPDAEPAVLTGEAYPTFSSVEEQAEVATATATALRHGAGAGSELVFHAGPAPEDSSVHLPGLISLAVDCGEDPNAQAQAAALLSLALKGALQGPDGSALDPLVVTNVSATPETVAALCRAAIYPRIALRAAILRQAVAFMGHVGDDGAGFVEACTSDGNIGLFSPQEVKDLKDLEAAAVALQKKRRQALARQEQEQRVYQQS